MSEETMIERMRAAVAAAITSGAGPKLEWRVSPGTGSHLLNSKDEQGNSLISGRSGACTFMGYPVITDPDIEEFELRQLPKGTSADHEETMKARVTAAIVEQLREQGVARGVAVDIDGDLAQVDGSFRLGPIVGAVIAAMREADPPVPILDSKV